MTALRTVLTAVSVFVVAQAGFLIGIGFPAKPSYDETHYVPAAKLFMALLPTTNWEHPPLGKVIIALGMQLFGDNPIGWRGMSTIFGALTLVGIYLLALVLWRRQGLALVVTAITAMNNLLYVHARIAMLDTFMAAFVVWGILGVAVVFTAERKGPLLFVGLYGAGVCFGLGAGSKWFAVVPWVAAAGLLVVARLWPVVAGVLARRGHHRLAALPFAGGGAFANVALGHLVLALWVVPLLAYAATFIPFAFIDNRFDLDELLRMQLRMWDGQQRVTQPHPYMSTWPGWPLMLRPMWYVFDKEGEDFVRCIFFVGNPAVMWGGVVALVGCAAIAARLDDPRRKQAAFLTLFFWLAMWLCWLVIPRKVAFFYYYYPAALMLGPAIGAVLAVVEDGRFPRLLWRGRVPVVCATFVAVTLALFVYFLPALTAEKTPLSTFHRVAWFASWI